MTSPACLGREVTYGIRTLIFSEIIIQNSNSYKKPKNPSSIQKITRKLLDVKAAGDVILTCPGPSSLN